MNAFRLARALLLAVLCLLAGLSHAAPTQRWTLVELGDLAGGIGSSTPQAINNRGEITGTATAAVPSGGFQTHAFLWSNGTMIDLGLPPGTTLSTASDLTDRGTVLGGDSVGNAYLVEDGVWTPLPQGLFAGLINKFEAVAGQYSPMPGRLHGFLYRDGVLFDTGTLGGTMSAPRGLNDKGAIVGSSTLAGAVHPHAFVWQDGIMEDLGTLGGAFSTAEDINDHGVIVGASLDAAGNALAFVHDRAGMRRLLPDLPPPQRATAINDRGAIVGDLGQNGSFMHEDGTTILLESISEVQAAGFARLVPTAINDRGWITGWGWKPDGPVNGLGFVLIPR